MTGTSTLNIGHAAVAELLLSIAAPALEAVEEHGRTALHHALDNGRAAVAELPLDRGVAALLE